MRIEGGKRQSCKLITCLRAKQIKDLGSFTSTVCGMGYHSTYGWIAITYEGHINHFVRFSLDLSDGTYTETQKSEMNYPWDHGIN